MTSQNALGAVAAVAVSLAGADRASGDLLVGTGDKVQAWRFSEDEMFEPGVLSLWTPDADDVVLRACPATGGPVDELSLVAGGEARPAIDFGLGADAPVSLACVVSDDSNVAPFASIPVTPDDVRVTTAANPRWMDALRDDRRIASFVAGGPEVASGGRVVFILVPGLLVLAGLTLALSATRRW